jgi:hypothetical protein
MRSIGTYVFFAICVVVTLAALVNARRSREVDAMAKAVACTAISSCAGPGDPMRSLTTTPFQHTYGFSTKDGMVEVRCRRAQLLTGPWSCSGELALQPPVMQPGRDFERDEMRKGNK